jgi:hypothetical protein
VTGAADDRGSVLVLGIGLIAACLLAVVVLVDATSAFLQRQHLLAVADAAALAGAQAVDLPTYYEQGASAATRLDVRLVPGRVQSHLQRTGARRLISGLAVDEVSSDGLRVVVGLSAPLVLPFLSGIVTDRIRVESVAQLAYRG